MPVVVELLRRVVVAVVLAAASTDGELCLLASRDVRDVLAELTQVSRLLTWHRELGCVVSGEILRDMWGAATLESHAAGLEDNLSR
ncbi:hypothetical protein HBH52_074260 [Parastagonospora nodorum]|nr:hypothetical protein HBH52_074260 [Parastagonospora nodorum]